MIAVFGWGVVAPNAGNLNEFEELLQSGRSALTPIAAPGLAQGKILVGDPRFDFNDCHDWIASRKGEARFTQLAAKCGENTLFALGALIQAIESNPALEPAIARERATTPVFVGSGLGDLPQIQTATQEYEGAVRRWMSYWAAPERNASHLAFVTEGRLPPGAPPPPDPRQFPVDSEQRWLALATWNEFWAQHSERRASFEDEYCRLERLPVGEDHAKGPLNAIRAREKARRTLLEHTDCPMPPWNAVDPRLVWSVQNVAAAQISMLLGTHGPAWAPVGACSTFGVALKQGRDAIACGDAALAIVGSTDPRPNPVLISAFHRARLAHVTGEVCQPMTSLNGTHIAGGACVWILGDVERLAKYGLHPIGPSIEAVAISSDAGHIITPSADGPKRAIRRALDDSATSPDQIAVWDMHATGTPGDIAEFDMIREYLGPDTLITARKGLFGHGMANAGGWEMTALGLGIKRGEFWESGPPVESLHAFFQREARGRVGWTRAAVRGGRAVKVMLGVGGISTCVVLGHPRAAAVTEVADCPPADHGGADPQPLAAYS